MLAVALLLAGPPRSLADEPEGHARFRVAFSSSMFTDVNESDARASVKAWASSVAKERALDIATEPVITPGLATLGRALRSREVDGVGINAVDFLELEGEVRWGRLFAAISGGQAAVAYDLLVHRDSGVERIEDLRGRAVVFHRNPRTCLAGPWLDGLLRDAGLPAAQSFFGRVSAETKLSQAVLPVFFGQADACVVTRQGFLTMAELNPQLGKQLRALATSEEVVPSLFAFRGDYEAPSGNDLITALLELHLSAAGRQVLTIFQSERLEEIPPSALESARRILRDGQRAGRPGSRSAAPGQADSGGGSP